MGKSLAALGIAVLGASAAWFSCTGFKYEKSSKSTEKTTIQNAPDGADATDTDAATDAADTTDADSTAPDTGTLSTTACGADNDCNLKYVNCAGKTAAQKESCEIAVQDVECCAACDCQETHVLNSVAAICVQGECKAQPFLPADAEAKCLDPKPTGPDAVVCANLRCNNEADHYAWMTPVDAAKARAACQPCPNC